MIHVPPPATFRFQIMIHLPSPPLFTPGPSHAVAASLGDLLRELGPAHCAMTRRWMGMVVYGKERKVRKAAGTNCF